MDFEVVKVFNAVDFAVVNYTSATSVIIKHAVSRNSFGVFAMPSHGLVLASSRHPMAKAVEHADMIVPDGQPVRWIMNLLYGANLKDRVYGPTLTLHVLQAANDRHLKIFLYGGNTQDTLEKFAGFINEKYPSVNICGMFREINPQDETLSPETINASGAHLVLIGRGCPVQELWIAKVKTRINAVTIGVGAAFSFHAGNLDQAPRWMQNYGLEWLFRLIKEPRRLFKRYAITNSIFIWLTFREIIRKYLKPGNTWKYYIRNMNIKM